MNSTSSKHTKDLVMTALMAALVFTATYVIRIPNPLTGGYTHLGDCMIFLAVVLLGRKNGVIAAGLGGALSDFLAGAPIWILPTLIIKSIMAFLMGSVIKKNPHSRIRQLAGASVGGIFQVAGYTLVNWILMGQEAALLSIPNETIQTGLGIILFAVLYAAMAVPLKKIMK